MKSEFSNENYLFTCMRSLVGFQVWTFGVDLLTIGETTFVDSSLFIIDRWIKTQVCVWQGAFESHGRLCKRNEPGNHFSSPGRHPYDGTPSTIGSGHSHQAGGEGFQRRGSWNIISLESPRLRRGGGFLPDSGEEGGVRGWGGLGAPLGSVIFTVSWSAALLSAGLTTLLFSNFTTGEKGGVSPSSEWMLELEELEDNWPGEE